MLQLCEKDLVPTSRGCDWVMSDFLLKWLQMDTSCESGCLSFQFCVCVPSKKAFLVPLPFRAVAPEEPGSPGCGGEHTHTARAHPLHVTSHRGVPGN